MCQNSSLLSWLQSQAKEITRLEKAAEIALNNDKNKTAYHRYMVEKAELLSKMFLSARPFYKDASPEIAEIINTTLTGFSQNAMQALKLNSVFYMSALLYPDEHKAGEPNNLEKLVIKIEQACKHEVK